MHGSISSAKLSNGTLLSGEISTVLHYQAHDIDGLAVDWIFRHIYWTDTGTNTISMANYEGTKVRTLIKSDLYEPKFISLDPENG